MGKIKRFIITTILFIFGALLILGSIFYKSGDEEGLNGFDLTDNMIGKTVTMAGTISGFDSPNKDHAYIVYHDEDTGDYSLIRCDLPVDIQDSFYDEILDGRTYVAVVHKADSGVQEDVYDVTLDYYDWIEETTDIEISEEEREETWNHISPYYLEVIEMTNESDIPRVALCITGAVFVLFSIVVLIALLMKKSPLRAILITTVVLVIVVGVAVVITFNKLRSFLSIENEGDGLYSMTYYGDLKTDELLEANITSTDELVEFIRSEEFFNAPAPVEVDESNFGCAAFASATEDGDQLFGRNMDYPDTDTLVIYTDPSDGYASYACADLAVLGVSGDYGLDSDSTVGRLLMLAAPYVCCDGINETGLGIALLELDIPETHQDTDNPDVIFYSMIRVILDSCASVDEAIDLLGQYDMNSALGVTYHLFICDSSGRSVVVEWIENEMYVNEADTCTNSVLTPGEWFDIGADERLGILDDTLEDNNNILTPAQGRDLLEAVSQGDFTEWSCVYNLTDFEFDIYVDGDYENGYSFGR